MLEAIQAADTAALLFIQENIRCGFLDAVMTVITRLGNGGAIWLLPGVILFMSRTYRKVGFDIVIAVGLCWCLNELGKHIFLRPRPFAEIEGLLVMIPPPTSGSFPSGHTCSSFAAAYAYTRGFPKYGAWSYIPAVLIGVSRIYVGVHYPSDVFAGAVLGTVSAAVVYALSRRFVKIPVFEKEEPPDDGD